MVLDLDSVFSQFSAIQVCIEKRLCDGSTAHSFLAGSAPLLWFAFRPYVTEQRRMLPSYAIAFERFATQEPQPEG